MPITGPDSRPDADPAEIDLGSDLLIRSDAVDAARRLPGGCLDLVYLDPPFGSGRRQRPLRGRAGRYELGQESGFDDPAGLPGWLPALLTEGKRLLRPGGGLFLHLDFRTVHHARFLLDSLFGADNFLNEVIWHYATGGIPGRWFARKHDNLLFYRNGEGHRFHVLREKKYLAHRMGRRGVEEFRDERGWYRFRSLDDVWEIPWLTQDAHERTGYPTQKPLALLERILAATTDPGDRVADFCCGSGTTAVAARRMDRRWIAADVSEAAIRIARQRLETSEPAGGEASWPAAPRPFRCEDWGRELKDAGAEV